MMAPVPGRPAAGAAGAGRVTGSSLLAIFAAIVLLISGSAFADDRPDANELRDRLDQLESQIARERAGLEADQADRDEQLRAARERRRELATDVLEREASRERLARRERELRQRAGELGGDVEALRSARGEVIAAARSVGEQATILLAEQPGGEPQRETLRAALEVLDADTADEAGVADALATLVQALAQVHEHAAALRLQPAEIYNAHGERETVHMLSAGHVSFAYRSADGERVGLALRSPADASGYRWSEALPAVVAEATRAAFDQAEAGAAAVAMPTDVSRQLRVESVVRDEGLAAMMRSGGVVMIPLALVALVALLLVLERAWVLYGRNRSDQRVVAAVLAAAREGHPDAAQQRAEHGGSVVARTLAACLRRRRANTHAMEDSIQEQLLHELPRLQRFLGGIALLAAVAPLLGLLGTVTGIIQTFGVIRAFGNANPSLMAGGISEALMTTATGLSIAIPILLLHAMLRGRVDRILADAEKHAATLLNILAHDGGGAGGDAPDAADTHGKRTPDRPASSSAQGGHGPASAAAHASSTEPSVP